MPKIEAKIIQRELEQGLLWPVYWLYGQEIMKSRELLKRIRRAALGESNPFPSDETFNAGDSDADAIMEAARSIPMGGGIKFVLIKDAHLLKTPEALAELMGPRAQRNELNWVCVFISKDLDARKKFSKTLVEKAAVVPCEEVPEAEREAWIKYLAKSRALELTPASVLRLLSLETWTLDLVDLELEKLSLNPQVESQEIDPCIKEQIESGMSGVEAWIESFFMKNRMKALLRLKLFADYPDEALPLLGLLAWNVRHLALLHKDRNFKLNPYVQERFRRWLKNWSLEEILALQKELETLDFQLKQTPLLPLGSWHSLVMRFC